MRVGFIGLGKVGLPCALTLAHYGSHQVTGYDVSDRPRQILAGQAQPHLEEGLPSMLTRRRKGQAKGSFAIADSAQLAASNADAVVIAVQTPHGEEYGGDRPAPDEAADFDYGWLKDAVRAAAEAALGQKRTTPVIVLSTVLPGTMGSQVAPLANEYTPMAYSPAFISLGTTIRDFREPAFVLCGTDSGKTEQVVRQLYSFTAAPVVRCDFVTAELVKMCSNMFDTLKITFANWIAEAAWGLGADGAEVASALRRYRSGTFPEPGMPDGGPCRPRDLIALSHLASRTGMSFDLPRAIGTARERHAQWLAALADDAALPSGLPVVLMGDAYKASSDLADGSPALLLRSYLKSPSWIWAAPQEGPAVFVVTNRYAQFVSRTFPEGSTVIDPWGITGDQPGVAVIRPGRH